MQLNPFEAGRYDEESIVVANPANGKQELFSEREFAIVKFLKQNEKQSLLALLMPNIGIAKKSHIEMCLRVLSKLRRMQIADYFSITGRKPESNTDTLEMFPAKQRIEFTSLNALAATIYGLFAKMFAPLGPNGLLGLVVVLAALAFAFFPFDAVPESFMGTPPSYLGMFAISFLVGSFALSFRALMRAAFLRGAGRDFRYPALALYFPLIALSADTREVNLLGFRARVQMAVLGLISPFVLSSVFTLFAFLGVMSPAGAFVGFAACTAVSLVLAGPIFPFDGAELLQAIFFREELEEKVSNGVREVLQAKSHLGREMIFVLFLTLVWFLVWCDCLSAFRQLISGRLAEDLTAPLGPARIGAVAAFSLLFALLLAPVGVMLFHDLRLRSKIARRKVVVQKDKVRDSLTFEERIAALEKIPLFASLNDQERLALLTEMQPAFYKHGDFLVHQGELGREFFVLVKGQANAYYTDVQGKGYTLADLVAGDAFGEIALIDDVPRTASIVSDGGCIVLVLRKEGFDRFTASLGSPDRVKSMIRLTSFFRRHPLFSKLSPRDQAQLIDSFRFQTITEGEQVPSRDDSFHVIYSGIVRVDTGGGDAETDLTNDDCFGYANPLNARFVAMQGSGILSVEKDEFHNLIWEKLVQKPELFV